MFRNICDTFRDSGALSKTVLDRAALTSDRIKDIRPAIEDAQEYIAKLQMKAGSHFRFHLVMEAPGN